MLRTLKDHLESLESRLVILNRAKSSPGVRTAKEIDGEIHTVERALAHFQAALELESRKSFK